MCRFLQAQAVSVACCSQGPWARTGARRAVAEQKAVDREQLRRGLACAQPLLRDHLAALRRSHVLQHAAPAESGERCNKTRCTPHLFSAPAARIMCVAPLGSSTQMPPPFHRISCRSRCGAALHGAASQHPHLMHHSPDAPRVAKAQQQHAAARQIQQVNKSACVC